MFTDRNITCKDCGSQFTFTAGEQQFYSEKGFQNEPQRCKDCRSNRKQDRGGRGGGGGGRGGGGGGRSFGGGGGGNRGPRQMYDAVCTSCGANTQVPFKPNPDKPIYCRDCFKKPSGNF